MHIHRPRRNRHAASHVGLFESLEQRRVFAVSPGEVPSALYDAGAGNRVIASLAVDMNDDGHEDLVVFTDNGKIGILRGDGEGDFRRSLNARVYQVDPSYSDYGMGDIQLIAGDFDGDGDKDLVIVNDYYHEPYRSNTGTHYQVVWRMLNSDGEGRLDKAGRSVMRKNYSRYQPDSRDDTFPIFAGAVANVDDDAKDEILVTVDGELRAYTFTNGRFLDKGTFLDKDVRGIVRAADIDDDGDTDLLVTSGTYNDDPDAADVYQGVKLFRRGDAGFALEDITTDYADATVFELADLNGDGSLDIVYAVRDRVTNIANPTGGITVLALMNDDGDFDTTPDTLYFESYEDVLARNNPGQFITDEPENFVAFSDLEVSDENADGRPDLFFYIYDEQYAGPRNLTVYNHTAVILYADGPDTSNFPAAPDYDFQNIDFRPFQPYPSVGVRLGDFDEDGKLDTVSTATRSSRFTHVSLSSDHRPIGDYINLQNNIENNNILGGQVFFERDVAPGSFVERVVVFLDVNLNGTLDDADRRLDTTNTPEDDGTWAVRFTRDDSWVRGRSFTIFAVAESNTGEVSTPLYADITFHSSRA